jgi:hypothetical protein
MVNQLPYDKWTKRELLQCLKWTKKILRLMDWDIQLETHADTYKTVGEVLVYDSSFNAAIRLNNKQCKVNDISPAQVLIHEMIHIATLGKTKMAGGNSEFVSQLFEYPLTRLCVKECKL